MHFGKINADSTDSLIVAFGKINPDLIIISGDLTQRAKEKQFESAKIFLDNLKKIGLKYLAIPGNHDIEPLWKPISRINNPYKNYKNHISKIIEPTYTDSEMAIAGINTVRPGKLKNGRISKVQVSKVQEWFSTFPSEVTKIIVTHHPLDLPLHKSKRELAQKASRGIGSLALSNIDLYLSGHFHQSSVITTVERYSELGYHAIALQAGTLSLRERGEVQSFNIIHLDKPKLLVETFLWDSTEKTFIKKHSYNFLLVNNSWKKL